MERRRTSEILDSLHEELGRVYAGGDSAGLRSLLTDDVEWHVPGQNAIAGSYRGLDQVLNYFLRRRELAAGTLRLHPGEVLTGGGDHVAVLTDGSAVIAGREQRWSTIGLYRIRDRRIAACWLLPLDPVAFDQAWSAVAAR